MIRTLLCSGALLLAGPAFAQSATGGQEMAPAEQAAPADSAQPSTVDVAVVVDSEFPSYDGDKNGELSQTRSEEHTSELQSLMRISYAVFCLKKNKYYMIILLHYLIHSHVITLTNAYIYIVYSSAIYTAHIH